MLLRAINFWEHDALQHSVPAAVRALTGIHALHGATSSREGGQALRACEELFEKLVRALGMVQHDNQRVVSLVRLI